MHFRSRRGNRRTITLLWVLCTICTLFSRICFDNTQADSSLAYADIVFDIDAAGTELVSDSSAAVSGSIAAVHPYQAPIVCIDGTIKETALRSAPKGVSAQQAYVSESSVQGSTAFIPRKTAQRINPRGTFSNASGILPEGIFSDTFFSGRSARSSDGICEIISNTVILRYIHRQDGEKA